MYCALRLKWTEDVGAFLARGAAVAGIICALLHFFLENSQWPSTRAWLAAIAAGALPTALANIFWDLGMRRGDQQLSTVLAYGTPLSGAVFLSLFGLEPFTWRILAAGVLVGVAGLLSTAPPGPNAPAR